MMPQTAVAALPSASAILGELIQDLGTGGELALHPETLPQQSQCVTHWPSAVLGASDMLEGDEVSSF